MSKVKEKLLKAGLVLAVFVGLNLVTKAMAPPITYDPVADVYEISTPGDLEILAMFVADVGGIATSPSLPPYWTSQGKTFVLMNDIVGFEKSIGNSSNPFMGTFDGNGHKITLAVSTVDLYYLKLHAGIFDYTSGATIKNLTVSGYITYSNDDPPIYPQSIGAIVNYGNNTTITNCINLVDITIDCPVSIWIAGIAGYLFNSTITSCSNAGNIITTGDGCAVIGGIVTPISDYEMYGFEASEVSPNIVTNNAVMDVRSAAKGYLTVAIFDMLGAKVMEVVDKNVTTQSQTQVELNGLNNLTAGSYMVAVSVGNNVVFKKFIKQ